MFSLQYLNSNQNIVKEHKIVNSNKTVCLHISAKSYKPPNMPTVYLNNAYLKYVSSFKYLEFVINKDFNDCTDVEKQISLYDRANMLVDKCYHCTSTVKARFFQSYYANMYSSHFWWNYMAGKYTKELK